MLLLQGKKTALFSVLFFVVGIANLIGFADFELSTEVQQWYIAVMPVIYLALRHFTTTRAAWR